MTGKNWIVWCGVGTVEENHQEISGLTKAEAISMAEEAAKCWPRVLAFHKSNRFPYDVEHGGHDAFISWYLAKMQKIRNNT